ncbi:MAG: patatin-like phospholipase family protein, partial [Xanthomonadales bacterium]|nr:patatin-like phospholipase family protein [Xanthomonadales bacterium]
MRIFQCATPCALLLFHAGLIGATECQRTPAEERPTIGLALGGGGARGYAHIGVLQRLHELRVPVDYVAGTSIGSVVGGLVATGRDPETISSIAAAMDWAALFEDSTERQALPFRRKQDDALALVKPKLGLGKDASLLPRGAISGQKIAYLFESLLNETRITRDFDGLPIPFRAVAAELSSGDQVVLSSGSLGMAMRASMAVPAVFEPVRIDGKELIDGGIANNLPISVTREMGADVVIAVNVGSGYLDQSEISDVLSVAEQLTNILVERTTREQKKLLTARDILIEPPLGTKVTAADFDSMDEG